MNNLTSTASIYLHSGLSVIPTLPDKRPACPWKTFAGRPMTDREISIHFCRASGIGVVTGKVSGNLELLDFDDGGSRFDPWMKEVPPHIKNLLVVEGTPSGGKHVYYRVKDMEVPGNRKLAMKSDGHVLIETRGEGGYVKCAPSEGYNLEHGSLYSIPTISPLEEQLLIELAKKFDETAAKTPRTGATGVNKGISPLPLRSFDYADSIDIRPVLVANGWKKTKDGENEHWERPGKDGHSTSATFNGDVFYVFSSNAAPFDANTGYSKRRVLALLGALPCVSSGRTEPPATAAKSSQEDRIEIEDPGPVPDALLRMPGFVDMLVEHTLSCAPYPNRALAFAGALTMLSHLTGRNFRDRRNLRTNIYLLALADSGVGKDFPRKVNMNLAAELGVMGGMADRFASAEGLEDALLVRPCSFFQVDEVDTLFASLADHGDSSMEKIYGALLQFATSADTTYAMRKKAIQQTGGKAGKFDKIRARGIREPHLTLFGTAIPKYLFSAVSERAMENGLLSRCLVIEAGPRGKAGDPHFEPFSRELMEHARHFVSLGGFEGLDLENLNDAPPPFIDPFTVEETIEASDSRAAMVAECEKRYDASKTTAEKALWSRAAEKTSKLALLYALSENPESPLISAEAVDWSWRITDHLTKRMLYQASVYVHDNEFDALRQKALRYLRDYGKGTLTHGILLRYMHIDADTFRRVIDTLLQSELISAMPLTRGGYRYSIVDANGNGSHCSRNVHTEA